MAVLLVLVLGGALAFGPVGAFGGYVAGLVVAAWFPPSPPRACDAPPDSGAGPDRGEPGR